MNIQEIKAIKKALHTGGPLKSRAKIWRVFSEEYGLGRAAGEYTVFTWEEILQLRKLYESSYGIDSILSIKVDGSRDDFAQQRLDEKVSNRPVFADFVWLASAYPIATTRGNGLTPASTLIAVKQQDIILDHVSHLILVENGSPIINWQDIKLPKDILRPLFVYRGHSRSLIYVAQLFNRAQCRRVAFVDIDPSGLRIACHDIPCHSILLPFNWQHSLVSLRVGPAGNAPPTDPSDANTPPLLNKTATFLDQTLVTDKAPERWEAKAKWLADLIDQHKVAVMQEHLMTSGLPLVEYPLGVGSDPGMYTR